MESFLNTLQFHGLSSLLWPTQYCNEKLKFESNIQEILQIKVELYIYIYIYIYMCVCVCVCVCVYVVCE
jgi:hypothetical protein